MIRALACGTFAALVLSACAGALPWNPQGYAGINKAEISFDEEGRPSHVLIVGGKEQETISLDFEMPNGLKASYKAEGVKAFRAHEVRAAVEQAISDDVKEAVPGIVDTVVKAILGL